MPHPGRQPRPRPGQPPPPTDTTSAPTDTTGATTDTASAAADTTGAPTDTTGAPTDTTGTGGGETQGRLFTVRIAWDPGDEEQTGAMDELVAVLEAAGVPVWPVEAPGDDDELAHRRVAALRNAAAARTLGNHIEEEYGLEWEWVHIDKDETVPPADVAASMTFVDGLSQGPGQGPGQGGNGGTNTAVRIRSQSPVRAPAALISLITVPHQAGTPPSGGFIPAF